MRLPFFDRWHCKRRAAFCCCFLALSFTILLTVFYEELLIRQPSSDARLLRELEQEDEYRWSAQGLYFGLERRRATTLPFPGERPERTCDVFSGEWVYDAAAGGPSYAEEDCPFVPPKLMCRANGRPDDDYLRWRWQPHGCYLPSFNATFMLEMLRGKRVVFVGDHLHRAQFASLLCLLHRAVPDEFESLRTRTDIPMTTFRAENYDTTIEFYYAPLLLESNREHAPRHRVSEIVVREGSIETHGRHWEGADVLVFNSYTWWLAAGTKIKILRGSSFEDEKAEVRTAAVEEAYGMALGEMVRWVEKNMDPLTTRVFFTTMSPSHEMSEEWGGAARGNCYYEAAPILGAPNYWGRGSKAGLMQAAKRVLAQSPIVLLDITQLSEYRKDAHVSIFGAPLRNLTAAARADPRGHADCRSWCLPGLPDTWNELLYVNLFFLLPS